MLYGALSLARAYDHSGRISQWLQDFLRADGLIEEDPHYLGLRDIPIGLLASVPPAGRGKGVGRAVDAQGGRSPAG